MKERTIHLPDAIVDAIEAMVDRGLFLTFSEAVRTMLADYVMKYEKLAVELGELPGGGGERKTTTSLRLPRPVSQLLEKRARELGYPSKSELVRLAVIRLLAEKP
jgi:Arc/MetJ-type ribon-helix-helix transcriptional regulator